ncbi:MAG: hypothetical protein IKJ65_07550 [Clostridia bacterium]|nr:hypothetical protein [Clostridia bacterium]
MHAVVISVVVFLALCLLYEFGFIALQSKRAMLFTASINGMKAKFSGCTGKITRIVRFKEQKVYMIRFEKTTQKGSVRLSLYDSEKNALIESGEEETYSLSPVAGKRYKLTVRMEKASGNYKIEIQ